jgi:2,4-dienoyl-CoA reductase-like NADH-dependent reductase (Old Yellow Enzyme family)
MIFDPFTIKGVTFKNRLVRSSMGGRLAYYDGTINDAWKNFETRFAKGGVAGLISATLNVGPQRWSPLEYPQLSNDKFIKPLADGIRRLHDLDCRYIIQIGDAGYHTQTSLFSQVEDEKSASKGFDLLYGYRSLRRAMTVGEIEHLVELFGQAARRVRETGADGVEVTASKGYVIQQFLNPAVNRRTDRYGGSVEKRFQLLKEVVTEVRSQVGEDRLLGVRLSANDCNYHPINVRLPVVRPLREYFKGNDIDVHLTYAKWLKDLGTDYLLVTNGFGFTNAKEQPGDFPLPEVKMFMNSTRHLSWKAAARSTLLNVIPDVVTKKLLGVGWKYREGANLADAKRFKDEVGLPVIANGGFQHRSFVEKALFSGSCDLVSMARPLLANPDLPEMFRNGQEEPERPCTFCNRCALRTTLFPVGCYEPRRFDSLEEMETQILSLSGRPLPAE